MNMVKRFYGILEENISLIMRVFVILTVTVVLLLHCLIQYLDILCLIKKLFENRDKWG